MNSQNSSEQIKTGQDSSGVISGLSIGFPKVGKLRSGVFEAEEGEEKEEKQVQLKEICSSNICTIELVYDEL